jgi:PGF-pre-PGF domain-containing protein
MSNAATGVSLTVRALAGKPVIVTTNPNGTSYKYVEVISANLPDASIASAKIQFHVEKWWLNLNRLDKNFVYLQRWSSGTWQKLATSKISENDNYVTYEATTPGFSVFVITASATGTTTTISSTGTTLSGNTTNATGNQTELFPGLSGSTGSILFTAVIIALVIIIAAVLYLKRDLLKKLLKKKSYTYHEHKHKPEHHENHPEHGGEHKKKE